MRQQTAVRQADETICLHCGHLIKRDVRLCPECGTRIAAGPQHEAMCSSHDVSGPAARPATHRDVVEDKLAPAGTIGLILTYFLRRHGWLATWICIPVFIVVAFFVFTTSGSSP